MGIDGGAMVVIVVLVGMVVMEGNKGGGAILGVRVRAVRGTQARHTISIVVVSVPLTQTQLSVIGGVLGLTTTLTTQTMPDQIVQYYFKIVISISFV